MLPGGLFSAESLLFAALETYNLIFGLSLAFLISWTIYPFQYSYVWIWDKIWAKSLAPGAARKNQALSSDVELQDYSHFYD